MRIETYVPKVPHPQKYLNRPVRVRGQQVGRIVSAVFDTKNPERVKVTAEVDDALAPLLVYAPQEVTIDGLGKRRAE